MRWGHLLAKLPQVGPGGVSETLWFVRPRQGAAVVAVVGVWRRHLAINRPR